MKSLAFKIDGGPGDGRRHGPGGVRIRHVHGRDHDRGQRRPHGQAAGSDAWKDYKAGASFTVGAGKKFQLKVAADAAYLCLYR